MPGFRDRHISPDANIDVAKLAFFSYVAGKHTDATLPRIFWVSKGGNQGNYLATREQPLVALTGSGGFTDRAVDGRGDVALIGPGIWREHVDVGGTTAAKRDLKFIGYPLVHPGRIQIVGNGTTANQPTFRVQDGYLRGLVIQDLEIGSVDTADADRAEAGLELVTNDTGTLTATSDDEWAILSGVRLDGGAVGDVGLLLTGTQMIRCYGLEVSGWTMGVGFRGSVSNYPDHCHFWDTIFQDNVTADIATISYGGYGAPVQADLNMTNITFTRTVYKDRGGTPVTNYVNASGTMVNVGDYEFVAARDIADGTLMQLPINWIAIGRSAAAAEFVIGA